MDIHGFISEAQFRDIVEVGAGMVGGWVGGWAGGGGVESEAGRGGYRGRATNMHWPWYKLSQFSPYPQPHPFPPTRAAPAPQAEAINSKSEVAQLWRHHRLHPHKRPLAVPRLAW